MSSDAFILVPNKRYDFLINKLELLENEIKLGFNCDCKKQDTDNDKSEEPIQLKKVEVANVQPQMNDFIEKVEDKPETHKVEQDKEPIDSFSEVNKKINQNLPEYLARKGDLLWKGLRESESECANFANIKELIRDALCRNKKMVENEKTFYETLSRLGLEKYVKNPKIEKYSQLWESSAPWYYLG